MLLFTALQTLQKCCINFFNVDVNLYLRTQWRHWLEGTAQSFSVWTDHKNMEYQKAQLPTGQVGTGSDPWSWSHFLLGWSSNLGDRVTYVGGTRNWPRPWVWPAGAAFCPFLLLHWVHTASWGPALLLVAHTGKGHQGICDRLHHLCSKQTLQAVSVQITSASSQAWLTVVPHLSWFDHWAAPLRR